MKKYFAGVVGNILEHYDQALYGFLVPVLAPLFFPDHDPIFSLLCAYGLLPMGLFAKPLGALVFGWLGDRIGRPKTLSITLLGMAGATAGMGCLPDYEQVGWLAPTLLALGRLLQTFFAAGETTGGALFLLEQTEKKRRGWVSSLFDASSILGILLAAAAAALWAEHWRWLFIVGSGCAVAGLLVRKTEREPVARQTDWIGLWREWRPILAISLVAGYSYANYFLITSFFNGFLPLVTSINLSQAYALNTLLLFLDLALLPLFGYLTLRWEKEKLMGAALFAGVVCSLPFFLLLNGASAWTAAFVRIAMTVIGVCLAAPYHAWAMEQAPVERRFAVCAMGAAIGSRLIGAPMPMVSLWLYQKTHWVGSAALPLVLIALLAAGVLLVRSRAAAAPLRSVN